MKWKLYLSPQVSIEDQAQEYNDIQINESRNRSISNSFSTFHIFSAIFFITLLQFGWLELTMGSKIALINLLPATVFITVWTLFVTHYYIHKPRVWAFLLMPVLILNLRLPLSVLSDLQVINWLMYLIIVATVGRHVLTMFSTNKERFILMLVVVFLAFNALTHLGLDSPYTYTFRMMNSLPSAYVGSDNNETWECAYERSQFPVHCDSRHFIASEKIFTEPGFDPSYSVVLRRFLHGYLNSLAGLDGTRWWVNFSLNVLFWFFACACVYRICILLKQGTRVAAFSMLSCASGIGFIDMLAQPSPYLLAYAYGPFVIWATIELIYSKLDKWLTLLFIILISSVVMVYDAYQLILVSLLLLLIHKKQRAAVLVFLLAVIFSVVWRAFSMNMVLGTQGAPSISGRSISLLMLDVTTWFDALKEGNVVHLFRMSVDGMLAYLYGNLIIGALAAWSYIFGVGRTKPSSSEQKAFLTILIIFNGLTLLSSLFIVPQMMVFSPSTNMLPRMAFYTYAINMIALTLISIVYLKKYAWVTPLILLIIANINLSGFASIDLLFDYGRIGMFWK